MAEPINHTLIVCSQSLLDYLHEIPKMLRADQKI